MGILITLSEHVAITGVTITSLGLLLLTYYYFAASVM